MRPAANSVAASGASLIAPLPKPYFLPLPLPELPFPELPLPELPFPELPFPELPLPELVPPVVVPPVLVVVVPPPPVLELLPPVDEPPALDPPLDELDELAELLPADDANRATCWFIWLPTACPNSQVAPTIPPPMMASKSAYSAAVAPP